MSSLKDIQSNFSNAIYSRPEENRPSQSQQLNKHKTTINSTWTNSLNSYSREEHAARLSIYKNNVYHSLTLALKDLYPSVVSILGEDFFSAMAKVYIQAHPPKEQSLIFFASDFAEFLTIFEHTKQLLYLPDIARLEFNRHAAYHAEDQQTVSAEQASQIAIDTLCASYVELANSVLRIQSKFSIFTLWDSINSPKNTNVNDQQSKNADEEKIDIENPENVLIYRDSLEKNFEIRTLSLDLSLMYFLNLLSDNTAIGPALEQTLEKHPEFDASSSIAFLFSKPLVYQLTHND